jgi:hypothetical protein
MYDADHPVAKDAQKCTGVTDTCPDQECLACSVRECPSCEPLHFHHDGCPACIRQHEMAMKKLDAEVNQAVFPGAVSLGKYTSPSTDIEAAMLVLCKVRGNLDFLIGNTPEGQYYCYIALTSNYGKKGIGDTISEAICRCALLVMESGLVKL